MKFLFWLAATAAVFGFAIQSYTSGEMIHWFYFKSRVDGFAINERSFATATEDNPARLAIVEAREIVGPVAVPVRAGDVLPRGADGVIAVKSVDEARRVVRDGDALKIMVPYETKDDHGFKYRDGYKHKDIQPNSWSAVWNLAVILTIGLCLGMLAQSFTDLLGITYRAAREDVRPAKPKQAPIPVGFRGHV